MSIKKSVGNVKGFTLVELLIVVAIIGVLASQGVPAYRRMIQKSRKGEAQSLLAGIGAAESAFFSEYGVYGNNLVRMGMQSDGTNYTYSAGMPGSNACTQIPQANISPIQGNGGVAAGQVVNLPGNYTQLMPGTVVGTTASSMVGRVPAFQLIPAAQVLACPTTNLGLNAVAQYVNTPTTGVVNAAIPRFLAVATGNVVDPSKTCTAPATAATANTAALNNCDVWFIDDQRNINNGYDGVL